MKYLFLILLTGCASENIKDCVDDQVKYYSDLCAESSSGYEKMNGSDAHQEGVRCAVESINICIGE